MTYTYEYDEAISILLFREISKIQPISRRTWECKIVISFLSSTQSYELLQFKSILLICDMEHLQLVKAYNRQINNNLFLLLLEMMPTHTVTFITDLLRHLNEAVIV